MVISGSLCIVEDNAHKKQEIEQQWCIKKRAQHCCLYSRTARNYRPNTYFFYSRRLNNSLEKCIKKSIEKWCNYYTTYVWRDMVELSHREMSLLRFFINNKNGDDILPPAAMHSKNTRCIEKRKPLSNPNWMPSIINIQPHLPSSRGHPVIPATCLVNLFINLKPI